MNKFISKIMGYINQLTAKVGDKNMHLICSFIITFIFGLFSVMLGIFMGCVAGLGKEIYDHIRYIKYQEGVGFDNKDLVYDLVGIVLAVILLIII